MRTQPPVGPTASPSGPYRFLRLRYLLLGLVLASMLAWVWPRTQAALALHNKAVALADYGLCMVGPTGPELIRSQPEGFVELVRRRLVAAMPNETPLSACALLAEKLELEHTTLKLHQARASDFVEYRNDPIRRGRYSLASYQLPTSVLEQLAEAAWPFVRNGYVPLMQPSSHARQASHPASPPEVGWGRGLPGTRSVYRSTAAFGDTWVAALGSGANRSIVVSKNGGLDWTPGGERLASELMDRCVVDDEGRGFTLSRLNSGERVVVSQGPDAPPQIAVLSGTKSQVAGVSCDESALVAVVVGEQRGTLREVTLRLCPYRRPCTDLPLPELGGATLYYPVDIARVAGDTVLARSVGGISRLTSSRDNGQTWTPWIVAYDSRTVAAVDSFAAAPYRLLTVGDSVLLYGTARGSERYPVLVSTDHGASVHAPGADPVLGPAAPLQTLTAHAAGP